MHACVLLESTRIYDFKGISRDNRQFRSTIELPIDGYKLWSPKNYEMADSLANWGPVVPTDFVHNYETDA
jgi:hypothetical protein